MARETIGTVICPMLGDVCEVRKDKNGKLYYAGLAGLITPRTNEGQAWLRKHATIDGQELKASEPVIESAKLDSRPVTARQKTLLETLWGAPDEE